MRSILFKGFTLIILLVIFYTLVFQILVSYTWREEVKIFKYFSFILHWFWLMQVQKTPLPFLFDPNYMCIIWKIYCGVVHDIQQTLLLAITL